MSFAEAAAVDSRVAIQPFVPAQSIFSPLAASGTDAMPMTLLSRSSPYAALNVGTAQGPSKMMPT